MVQYNRLSFRIEFNQKYFDGAAKGEREMYQRNLEDRSHNLFHDGIEPHYIYLAGDSRTTPHRNDLLV